MASFDKINYSLRPSKQVERKLLIEALQRLSKAGYFMDEYTYLGLGSIYYADFILFHKYLFIDSMICSEMDSIEKRMKFNKPYNFIQLYMEPVSDVFPKIARDKKYFVWLDFDSSLDEERLADIRSCLYILPPGSVFLVTVTADTRTLNDLLDPQEAKAWNEDERKNKIVEELGSLFDKYIGRNIVKGDLSNKKLPLVYIDVLREYIKTCMDNRPGFRYYQLFNFKYADNLQMLTVGGIIDNDEAGGRLQESKIFDLDFVTAGREPVFISVPPMTIREKYWLEKYIVNNSNPPELAFEIKKELVDNFLKYYRHYPLYQESLV